MRQALRVKFICKYIAETRKIPKLFYAYRIVFSKKKWHHIYRYHYEMIELNLANVALKQEKHKTNKYFSFEFIRNISIFNPLQFDLPLFIKRMLAKKSCQD